MEMDTFVKDYEVKMTKTLSVLKQDYAAIRAGRANPALLDKITVVYYDVPTPLNQVATISVPEARSLLTPLGTAAPSSELKGRFSPRYRHQTRRTTALPCA